MTGHPNRQLNSFQYISYGFMLVLWSVNVWAEVVQTIDEQLIQAAGKGNLPMVRKILENETKISQDAINRAFYAGIKKGNKFIVQHLIDRGADTHYRGDNGYTALIQSARDGRSHLVRLLLSLGANVNAVATETEETALILAAQKNRKKIVDQLLAAEANLDATRKNDGMNALMLAARGGHQLVTLALVKAGAEVNHQLENGATALMLAAQHGHLDVIYVLLEAKADVNIKAINGATALTLANLHRHTKAAEMLKKAGAQ